MRSIVSHCCTGLLIFCTQLVDLAAESRLGASEASLLVAQARASLTNSALSLDTVLANAASRNVDSVSLRGVAVLDKLRSGEVDAAKQLWAVCLATSCGAFVSPAVSLFCFASTRVNRRTK